MGKTTVRVVTNPRDGLAALMEFYAKIAPMPDNRSAWEHPRQREIEGTVLTGALCPEAGSLLPEALTGFDRRVAVLTMMGFAFDSKFTVETPMLGLMCRVLKASPDEIRAAAERIASGPDAETVSDWVRTCWQSDAIAYVKRRVADGMSRKAAVADVGAWKEQAEQTSALAPLFVCRCPNCRAYAKGGAGAPFAGGMPAASGALN